MILYVNGDSNSAQNGTVWVQKLGKFLNTPIINQAQAGGSNPRVLRITNQFIKENQKNITDYFFVIGWTGWEREEWLWKDHYYQINAGGADRLPLELQSHYKRWVVDAEQIAQEKKSMLLHEQIIELHMTLKKFQAKHLFFNALMPFQHQVKTDPSHRFDWGLNYIGPYENDLSYFWYLKKQGYSPDSHNHYDAPAQECWGSFLIDYIQKVKL